MKKKNIQPDIEHSVSSGNIFADLGFSDAQERLAKVDLAIQIIELIKKKKLTQAQAAELLDIDQPKISALSQGKLVGFSLERLIRFLTILGQDITIHVTPKKSARKQANVSVTTPQQKSRKLPILQQNEIPIGRALHAKKKR